LNKKIIVLLGLLILLLSSCLTMTNSNKAPKPPRRVYNSVSTTGLAMADTFVVSDSFADYGLEPSVNSRVFATAMFFKDLGVLNDIDSSTFEAVSRALFMNFPATGEVKEIVIPALSNYQETGNEETAVEKDAYLFVSHYTTDQGEERFKIETNIPIGSAWDQYYDGYFINIGGNFHKDVIPASWIAVMNVAFKNDLIIYKGVKYPSMACMLNYSGTGIGVDQWMNNPISPDSNIEDLMAELKDVVDKGTAELSEDKEQRDSQLFLRKYTALTLAAYAFLNGDTDLGNTYFEQAENIDVKVPDNSMGKKYEGLEDVVSYVLNVNT
jgi:hypothetical protein